MGTSNIQIIEGKSYVIKYKRTTIYFVYEQENDWYRIEHITARDSHYAFIINKDVQSRCNYYNNEHHANGTLNFRELTADEIQSRNAEYNTWEQINVKTYFKKK
jgi:hypothetical protein